MNKKKLILLGLISLILMLSLAACSGAKSSKFPTGRFVNANDSSREVEYNTDNTWTYYMGGLMSAKGSYKIDNNLYIDQGTTECPFTGTYTWTFDGKNLSFKLSGEDNCAPRKEATDGQTFVLAK